MHRLMAFSLADGDSVYRGVALAFTVWMLIWVPIVLWAYGPQNFLWLCNLAQFVLLYALWRGDSLAASSQAGVVVLVGFVWTLDFTAGLMSGGRLAVVTVYMFNPDLPLLARATSVYHIWLPVLTLWLVWRLGYDRRGPWLQSGIGAFALLGTLALTEPERNINWVWSPFGVEQVWAHDPVYVLLLLVVYPVVLYLPGHWLVKTVLRWLSRPRST